MRRTLSLFLVLGTLAFGEPVAVPALTGRVVDEAHVLTASDVDRISEALLTLERNRGVQLAVLSVPSLGDDTIETFSMRVVEAWKLGKKGNDRGALFVFAPTQRKMRLEIGYGLEGSIPDAIAKRIVADRVRP